MKASLTYIRDLETSYVHQVSENYSRIKRSHPLCWTILLRLMTRQEQTPEILSSFLKLHGSKIQEDFSKSANSIGPIQTNPQQCLCLKLECILMKYIVSFTFPQSLTVKNQKILKWEERCCYVSSVEIISFGQKTMMMMLEAELNQKVRVTSDFALDY